jgi:hypothetical protein
MAVSHNPAGRHGFTIASGAGGRKVRPIGQLIAAKMVEVDAALGLNVALQ